MELALVGSLKPRLLALAAYAIVGGFRIVELVVLSLCGKHDGATIYIEGRDLGLPLSLDRYCKVDVRFGPIPDDVPKVDVSVAPYPKILGFC